MADQGSIANLKQNINENIYDNTDYDISGGRLNTVLQNVVDTLNFNGRDFFNVNEYREKSDAYADAAAGRAAVPDEVKKTGLVITYLLADGWYVDQFIGSNISGWGTASNWKVLGPVSILQNAETGHTDITIGSETTPVASVGEVTAMQNILGINGAVSIGKILKSDGTLTDNPNYYVTPFIPFGGGNFFAKASEISSAAYFITYNSSFQKVNSWLPSSSTDIVRNNLSSDYAYVRGSFKMDKTGYISLNSTIKWDNRTFDAPLVPAKQTDLNTLQNKIASLITDGYIFGGVISHDANPRNANPVFPTFYLCKDSGIYTNFGNLNCKTSTIIKTLWYQGAFAGWINEITNIASIERAIELAKNEVDANNQSLMNYLERATIETEPDVSYKPKIYIADTNGTYTNFIGQNESPIVLSNNECALLSKVFNNNQFSYWKKTTLNISTITKLVAYVDAAMAGYSPDPELIESAVTDWLDAHPEATTTVQDGSITEAKLAQNLATKMLGILVNYETTNNRMSAFLGYDNGNDETTGIGKNFVFGVENMREATTADRNVIIGYHSGFRITDATETVSIGNEACDNLSSGDMNTAVGANALRMQSQSGVGAPRDGDANTALGHNALYKCWGYGNIALGKSALEGGAYDCNISNNLAIGFYAGSRIPTGTTHKFYLDHWYRNSYNDEITKGMMYGEFSETPASQMLTINVGIFKLPYLPTSNPNVAGQIWNDNGIIKISSGV